MCTIQVKCTECSKVHEITRYAEILPCGHFLDKFDYSSADLDRKISALTEDGLNLSQALDCLLRKHNVKINWWKFELDMSINSAHKKIE